MRGRRCCHGDVVVGGVCGHGLAGGSGGMVGGVLGRDWGRVVPWDMLAGMLVYEPESLILAQSERWRNA
jgi:hypothetical protein